MAGNESEIIIECSYLIDILQLVATVAIGYFAYRIGKTQNEINQRSLGLSDFADVFLMPQTIQDSSGKVVGYNLLIKNPSSYPIYLEKYILNSVKYEVGGSIIPANTENWYVVPITKDVQDKGELNISIYFHDHTERQYKSDGTGIFSNGWLIRSKRRKELKK